ncbi:polycomb group RING finger protein 6 [Striga asiatica]|uniref:Polycomb group RING finger protein 6 n=1 Tax=Striga asiatica TaxID=4170 RepID=A0A5A7PNS8_STRAF|nr:polycomb group RING finger protein 6 [Striga asiatica]
MFVALDVSKVAINIVRKMGKEQKKMFHFYGRYSFVHKLVLKQPPLLFRRTKYSVELLNSFVGTEEYTGREKNRGDFAASPLTVKYNHVSGESTIGDNELLDRTELHADVRGWFFAERTIWEMGGLRRSSGGGVAVADDLERQRMIWGGGR